MDRIQRMVTALNIAGPFVLSFDDSLTNYPHCCVEASVAGAEALRRRGLSARPLRCMLMVDDGRAQWWCGATKREGYELMLQIGSGVPPTMEEWVMRIQCEWEDGQSHAVIEVEGKWILDLTASQLRVPELLAGLRLRIPDGDWPVHGEGRGLRMVYAKTSRGDEMPEFTSYKNEELVLDMVDGMRLALRADLDPVRFARMILEERRR